MELKRYTYEDVLKADRAGDVYLTEDGHAWMVMVSFGHSKIIRDIEVKHSSRIVTKSEWEEILQTVIRATIDVR